MGKFGKDFAASVRLAGAMENILGEQITQKEFSQILRQMVFRPSGDNKNSHSMKSESNYRKRGCM